MRELPTKSLFAAAAVFATSAFASDARAQSFSATNKARILYVGDSIAAETRDTVKWWTQIGGKAVLNDSIFPGLALCDFLDGKPGGREPALKLKAQVRTHKPHLVILQFWGNAFTECIRHTGFATEAYYNQYFWDALNAALQIRDAAAEVGIAKPRILWVLQHPDRGNRERPRRLDEGYAFAAGQFGDRTSDAGHTVSLAAYPYPGGNKDRYGWTQFLPCSDFERQAGLCTNPAYGGLVQLHRSDDAVHFCLGNSSDWGFSCDTPSPAIVRYGMRIASDANAWLGI